MLSMNSYTSTKSAGTVVGRYGKVRKRPGVTNPRPLGARFHDHCKCTVVPNIESQLPDGHAQEMERLEELWSDAVATVNSMGLKTGAEKSRAEVRVFSQYVRQADS